MKLPQVELALHQATGMEAAAEALWHSSPDGMGLPHGVGSQASWKDAIKAIRLYCAPLKLERQLLQGKKTRVAPSSEDLIELHQEISFARSRLPTRVSWTTVNRMPLRHQLRG